MSKDAPPAKLGNEGTTVYGFGGWDADQGTTPGAGAKGKYGSSVGQDEISVGTDQNLAPPQGQEVGATRVIRGGSQKQYGGT